MALKDRFFSVLNELVRQKGGKMPLEQWRGYLQPGRTLERGGVRFPLKADELKYGPLGALSAAYPEGKTAWPADELYNLLEASRRGTAPIVAPPAGPEFETLMSSGTSGSPTAMPTRAQRMHYENRYQLPGEKLAQAEELTLIPGSDFVASSAHFGGKPGLLSWSRTTRRPVSGTSVIKEKEPYETVNPEDIHVQVESENPYTGQRTVRIFHGNEWVGARSGTRDTDDVIKRENAARLTEINKNAAKEITTAQGETALHLEEIQSDWHQRAREEGYRGEAPTSELEQTYRDWHTNRLREMGYTDTELADPAMQRNIEDRVADDVHTAWQKYEKSGVPPAPYKDTYADLELRKGIAAAVENGDSYVTWTTGDQQAGRWGQELRNSVDEIRWIKRPDGKFDIAPMKGGVDIGADERFAGLDENGLEDLLGVDIAKRVTGGEGKANIYPHIEGEQGSISGANLTVGGAGMRLFYDRKVPEAARRLAKQYGGEVTKIKLPGGDKPMSQWLRNDLNTLEATDIGRMDTEQFEDLVTAIGGSEDLGTDELMDDAYGLSQLHQRYVAEEVPYRDLTRARDDFIKKIVARTKGAGEQEVWALKITPEMREKVLKAGLPLFSAGALAGVGAGMYADPAAAGEPEGYAAGGPVAPGPAPYDFGLKLHPWLEYFGLGDPTVPAGPLLVGADESFTAPAADYAPRPAPAAAEEANKEGTEAHTVAALAPSTLDLAAPYAVKPLEPASATPVSAAPATASLLPPGDGDYLAALEASESGGDPTARARTSSALGPYQFTIGTWADLAARYPALRLTPEGRTDPAQARLAVEALTKDNARTLQSLGEPPTDANLKLLHVFGGAGGPKLLYALHAAPDTVAAKVADPAAVKANLPLFYEKRTGRAYTVKELYDRLTAKFPGSTFAEGYLREEG